MTLVDADTGEVASGRIAVDAVVIDMAIYPRQEIAGATVNRYAEALAAGESLPPIIVEAGTNRLLDGMHRLRAHQANGEPTIEVERHAVPDGVPPKLYAASLSARHGDRMTGDDLRQVAREVVVAQPDYSMAQVARLLGVHRETVGRWCGDITERRRVVRQIKALLLTKAGKSIREAAEFLGVGKSTVSDDVGSDISGHLTDDLLAEALRDLPDECAAIADSLRDELIFGRWSEEEQLLLKRMREGDAVVVNQHRHADLIAWADSAGLYERIDRKSKWGNPFAMPDDGDRETVIANYREHYFPHKPSLHNVIHQLQGKALGCWCAPEPCHGDVLAEEVNGVCEG